MPSPDGRSEEGSWRLLNPLSIRFSQPRIAPHFRDGHLLVDTSAEVEVKPFKEGGGEELLLSDPASAPDYDCIILPPFPSIRVISFMPKIRRSDGEAERNERGDQVLGQRAWFALDNRRLYLLQQAAAAVWPKRCCAAVKCLEEVPGSTARELRKFRTTTEGRTVEIGARFGDDMIPWDWQAEVLHLKKATSKPEEVAPDGQFAEDLWDANDWAPLAVSIGEVTKEVEKKRDRQLREHIQQVQEQELRRLQKEKEQEDLQKLLLQEEQRKIQDQQIFLLQQELLNRRRQQQLQQQQRQQQQEQELLLLQQYGGLLDMWSSTDILRQAAVAAAGVASLGGVGLSSLPRACDGGRKLMHCPESGWEYVDPSGNVRGPFGLAKMRLWHQHGFFFPELPMRCSVSDKFRPFSELFPKPIEPFSGFVTRFSSSGD